MADLDEDLDGLDAEDRRAKLAETLREFWTNTRPHQDCVRRLERLTGLKIRVASRTPGGVSLHVELPPARG